MNATEAGDRLKREQKCKTGFDGSLKCMEWVD